MNLETPIDSLSGVALLGLEVVLRLVSWPVSKQRRPYPPSEQLYGLLGPLPTAQQLWLLLARRIDSL
jgi:hypothetical protein